MAMTEAERRAEESFLFGADSGAPPPPPLDDQKTLVGGTTVPLTGSAADAVNLRKLRNGGGGDSGGTGVDDVGDGVGDDVGVLESQDIIRERFPQPETKRPQRQRQFPENKSFEVLTDDDLTALAIANVFPKALEYDEDIDAGPALHGADTWYEDRYPTEGSAAERLAFLMKRRDSKREGVRVAKQFEFIEDLAGKAARYGPWAGVGLIPGGVPAYEAGQHYIPKAWEKVQEFKARLDRLETTEAENKALRERLERVEKRLEAMGQGPEAPKE